MDDSRGAFGAGLPGTAPRAAGPALHHEQTVGRAVSPVAAVVVELMRRYMFWEF